MTHSPLTRVALVLLAFAATGFTAENWPRWRGPNDNGCAAGGAYPVKWDANANVLWKAPLPGVGCSTPIVWERRIFLTSPADGQDAALAFDWSGKQLWQTTLGPERPGKHRNGSGSNPSPTTDGKGIFVYFKSGNLAALELDGEVRWKTNLEQRYGRDTLFWDYGSSPVLTDKDVVIALMHHGESWLAAFDKLTGALHWKVARNYETPMEGDHSYATPILVRHQGREALLVWGAQHLTAHDAGDGRLLWSCGNFNPDSKKNWVAVASAVLVGDMAVVPYGRGLRLHGIKLGGRGDVTATHRLWLRGDTGSFVPTPAACDGRVCLLRDTGEVECIDPATGRTLWSGAIPKSHSKFYASPVVADGRIYAAREDGVVFVVRANGPFELLAANDMGERVIASPVPVAGLLLIRSQKHLFCIGR
ncbi:MAG: PQQ-like beta-propeller repeat protein [Verrucomicrobiae bacterium]|nr:PQQ-like beta-propeller repeat protein [Verrucomicrobiae bacterium]